MSRGTALHGWVMGDEAGHYSIDLPNENATQTYNLRVEKEGTVPGTASANFTSASVPADGVNLQTGNYKVPVTFNFQDQNGDPVWGRVSVGANPLITFTGQNFFFSDNRADGSVEKGQVTAMVAPGNYSATAWGKASASTPTPPAPTRSPKRSQATRRRIPPAPSSSTSHEALLPTGSASTTTITAHDQTLSLRRRWSQKPR